MRLRSHCLVLVLTAGLVLPAAVVLPAQAAPKSGYSLRYALWQGGFNALSLEAGFLTGGKAYLAEFRARTEGFVGWLYPYRFEAVVRGQGRQEALRPRSYEARAKRGKRLRQRQIVFDPEGALEVVSRPASGRDGRYRDDAGERPLDPVSAVFSLIAAVSEAGRCSGEYSVFDGKRRYRFVARDGGKTRVKASDKGRYAGPARLCRVAIEPLAGFDGKKGRETLARLPKTIEVYLAPVVAGAPPLPVRLESASNLGQMIVYLTEARSTLSLKSARK